MLYLVFAKIALVAFGGGYANLPIIQSELLSRGWCTVEQFADIVAIAQMTPGPVVINTATYVGKTLAGIPGGISATLGFITPAVLITVAIYCLAKKLSSVAWISHGIRGIRAGVAGLILCAVIFFMLRISSSVYFPIQFTSFPDESINILLLVFRTQHSDTLQSSLI